MAALPPSLSNLANLFPTVAVAHSVHLWQQAAGRPTQASGLQQGSVIVLVCPEPPSLLLLLLYPPIIVVVVAVAIASTNRPHHCTITETGNSFPRAPAPRWMWYIFYVWSCEVHFTNTGNTNSRNN